MRAYYTEWKFEVCCCLVTYSCPLTLCNPIDCSPPGSSVRGISQSRVLGWVAFSFLRGSFLQSGVRKKKTHIYKESRKVALMNLFAGQQWRHIENRLVDTVEEGEGGTN